MTNRTTMRLTRKFHKEMARLRYFNRHNRFEEFTDSSAKLLAIMLRQNHRRMSYNDKRLKFL